MVEVGQHCSTPTTLETSAGGRRSMVALCVAFVQSSPMGGQTLTGVERLRDGAKLVSRCRRGIARALRELRFNPYLHPNPPSAIADAPPKIRYIWRSMSMLQQSTFSGDGILGFGSLSHTTHGGMNTSAWRFADLAFSARRWTFQRFC